MSEEELTEYEKGFIAGMRTYQLFLEDVEVTPDSSPESEKEKNWWD